MAVVEMAEVVTVAVEMVVVRGWWRGGGKVVEEMVVEVMVVVAMEVVGMVAVEMEEEAMVAGRWWW